MKINVRALVCKMFLAVLSLLAVMTASSVAAERPAKFSLESQQTPYRDQGDRGTCIAHSTVAALEAALKRAGYGDLNLSEEFFIQMTKNFWLAPLLVDTPSRAENRISTHQGGLGVGYVRFLAEGFGVPTEADLAYRPHTKPLNIKDDIWKSQFNVGCNNLDPRRIDLVKLAQTTFYSITGCEHVDGKNPEEIETQLLKNREVVWDFLIAGDVKSPIWQFDHPYVRKEGDSMPGHSVLIVGYDRTDPKNPYFIIKNSWAINQRLLVSYDYLRNYGSPFAAVITGVAPPKKGWSDLALIGRWFAELNGKQGVLDLYHLPGINQMNFNFFRRIGLMKTKTIDRRVGTFFLNGDPTKAYRVNGVITTNGLKLVIDWQNPNAAYDSLKGESVDVRFTNDSRQMLQGVGFKAVRLTSPKAFSLRVPNWAELPEVKGNRTLVQEPKPAPQPQPQPQPPAPGPNVRVVINGEVVYQTP